MNKSLQHNVVARAVVAVRPAATASTYYHYDYYDYDYDDDYHYDYDDDDSHYYFNSLHWKPAASSSVS